MLFRRSILAAVLAALLSQGYVEAQVCPGVNGATAQYASEPIVVSSTAIGFTAATINIARDRGQPLLFAEVTLETNPIRVRADGLAPTATVGALWNNAATGNIKFYVCGETSMRRFLAIRTGSDAAITAVYYTSQ